MFQFPRGTQVCVRRFAAVALVGFWFGTYPSLVWSQCDGLSTEQILGWGGATGDEIGVSVSVSGGVAVIGAHRDDDNGPDSGSAYIYRLGGGSWNPEQKLIPLDGASGDRFGSSVATSGDVVIVGAFLHYDNGTDSGSAYVFRFNGSNWIEEQELLPADGAAGDGFGASVAVSGNVAVIGAGWNDDNGMSSGSAYVFRFNGVNWIQEQKLLAADGASGDLFGHSVAVSGNVAIVGSRFDDDNGTDSGSSYVYRFNGASWTQEQKLLPLGGESEDYFGHSVGISDDVVVIGAYRDGDSDIGYFDTGAAYVFRFNGSSWIEESKLTASDRFSGDLFGKTVAVNGDQIVIGAPNSDKNCQWYFRPECGMAYLFEFTGSSWVEQTRLMEPETGTGTDHFGSSVAIASGVILVGSLSDSNDTNGTYGGAAYVANVCSSGTCMDVLGSIVACLSYPGGAASQECSCADLDRNMRVDLADFAAFQVAFLGS